MHYFEFYQAKMEDSLAHTPMTILTWIQGLCLLAIFQLEGELLSKIVVSLTSLLTLLAAWYKRRIEKENSEKLEKALQELLQISVENATLKAEALQFQREREDFRKQVRQELELLRSETFANQQESGK